jgi:hypothetical protein
VLKKGNLSLKKEPSPITKKRNPSITRSDFCLLISGGSALLGGPPFLFNAIVNNPINIE